MALSPYPGFERHPLDASCALWTGSLPDDLRFTDDGFDELWDLHPDAFHVIKMHGRLVKTPRWQQAYGVDYHYTGRVNEALPIPALLEPLYRWGRDHVDARLNALLVNWYDGSMGHYIGRHRDSTVGMAPGAPIVTVSFGEARTFRLRPWRGTGYRDFAARDGSVLIMPFETNRRWTHEVPLFAKQQGRRISVTLRALHTGTEEARGRRR